MVPLRVGIIGSRESFGSLVRAALAEQLPGARCVAADIESLLLGHEDFDVVVVDFAELAACHFRGLRRPRARGWPVVVVSAIPGEEPAVAALRAGADHYLRDNQIDRLAQTIEETRSDRSRRPEGQEAQLRQAQKMEALGRLAAGVAHDFNNLLTVISGYAELLFDRRGADEFMAGALREILKASEQASALSRQLLAFSRKTPAARSRMHASALVQNLARMARRLLGEEVELVTSLTAEPANVFADAGQLEQVVLNLVVNARDAILEQANRVGIGSAQGAARRSPVGQVTLSTSLARRRPAPVPGEQFVRLTVEDDGLGMTEEVRGRIFEPFFTTKPEGTGLGLAMVYATVQRHGGWVEVRSEPGHGAAFDIYLPLAPAGPTQVGGLPNNHPLRGSGSVLVVEDVVEVRRLASETLRLQGYEVREADNAQEALALLAALPRPVDLLLTDVVMPGLNGRALADEVVRRWPGVQVVYMSGYTEDAVLRNGVRTATVRFLEKPFTPLALARIVRDALDHPAPPSALVRT